MLGFESRPGRRNHPKFRDGVDPDALASMLMATIEGLCLYWATIGIQFDWGLLEKTLFSVVLDGISRS